MAHIHRVVPRWLGSMQFPTARGLMAAVEQEVIGRDPALEWCNRHGGTFAENLRWALQGHTPSWLGALGLQLAMPDYSYQHPKALAVLLSAADMLRHVGHHGLVLLLDEVENLSQQHDIRGRRKSYDALGTIKAHRTILPILFVTGRFLQMVEEDKRHGEWSHWADWTTNARHFVQTLSDVEVLRPPALNDRLAEELLQKLGMLHDSAYGNGVSLAASKADVLRLWRETATRSVRLLVRLAVNEFDQAKDNDI
jgi:hypothetical protein